MSSSGDPQASGEAEEVVAMDTGETEPAVEAEATSIWDVARQNSSKMVLQSVMDDMEDRAAKQKEELQQFRRGNFDFINMNKKFYQLEIDRHMRTVLGLQ